MLTWKSFSFLKGIISFRYDLPPTEAKRWILHFKRMVSLKWQSQEPSWQNRISCALFLQKRKSQDGLIPSPFSIRRRAQTMFERKDLTLSYTLFAVPSLPYISLNLKKISLSPLSWSGVRIGGEERESSAVLGWLFSVCPRAGGISSALAQGLLYSQHLMSQPRQDRSALVWEVSPFI